MLPSPLSPPLPPFAQAWIPEGRPSASLLYLYDGHWDGTLFDETFRVWGPASVGYGARNAAAASRLPEES